MAAQVHVERRIERMRAEGQPAAERCEVEVRPRRQVLHVFLEAVEQRADAGVRWRLRFLLFRLIRLLGLVRLVGGLLRVARDLGRERSERCVFGGHTRDECVSRRRCGEATDEDESADHGLRRSKKDASYNDRMPIKPGRRAFLKIVPAAIGVLLWREVGHGDEHRRDRERRARQAAADREAERAEHRQRDA